MKKFKLLISLSSLSLIASPITVLTASCSQTNYKEIEVPMLDANGKTVLKTNIMFKANSSIAYISLEKAMELVKQMHALNIKDTKFDYTISYSSGIYNVKRENGTTLDINPWFNTLTFSDYSKFVGSGVTKASDIANDQGGFEPSDSKNVKFLAYGSKDIRKRTSDKKVIYLSDYNISLREWNSTVYFPLQTISDLFLNAIYSPIFAIKNAIIQASTLPYGETGQKSQFPAYITDNKLEVNQELLDFNYNETCLWLDLDYGLKNNKSIQSFDQIFRANSYDNQRSLRECMLSSPAEYDKALDWTIAHIFDDGHSGYINCSIYDNDIFNRTRGETTIYRTSKHFKYYLLRDQVWHDEEFKDVFPQYLEVKSSKAETSDPDFAYITFDSFTTIPSDFKKEDIPLDPNDAPRDNAFALFTSAYAKILKEDNIKNIVVDVSNNGGGDGTFCLWLCSLLAGGEISAIHRNTTDDTVNICSYWADVNLDGKVNYSDQNFQEKKVYILTSPVSFSCANMLPTVLQQHSNVKVIGQKSDGGSCVVHLGCNALGTYVQLSGPMQIGSIHNGTFKDNDDGIVPAYYIDESIYYGTSQSDARKALTEAIVSHQ